MHYVLAPEWPPASLTSFPQEGDGDSSESEASLDADTKEQLRSQYLMSQFEAREREAMMHELAESAFFENSQRRTQVMMSVATPQQKKRKSPMKDGKPTA